MLSFVGREPGRAWPRGSAGSRPRRLLTRTAQAADLVAEWMRVGFIQGNMNSDNTAVRARPYTRALRVCCAALS